MNSSPPNDEAIDIKDLFGRIGRGLPQSIGLLLLGFVLAVAITWLASIRTPVESNMRVAFSFPGFERGLYPDESNFQPDDLRAADLTVQALKNLNVTDVEKIQSSVRGSISVSGLVPPNVTKERDKLRAAGQNPPIFVPDEYQISLYLPRSFPLSTKVRELFLNELVSQFRGRFQRIYIDLPSQYGSSFTTLRSSDYFEYELILSQEMQSLSEFLSSRLAKAKNFRAPSTGLSFSDLITQTQVFSQLRVNEVMGMIYSVGLTNNRALALTKMNYHLQLLRDDESRLTEEERVVKDLLAKAQERTQSYMLGARTQTESTRPMIDQGLIESLIANDSYNLLVRKALEAGLKVQQVRAHTGQVLERKKRIEAFETIKGEDNSETRKLLVKAMADLETDYNRLIETVRKTQYDYAHQQFADAIRITAPATTLTGFSTIFFAGAGGATLGLFLGLALSLLGVHIGRKKPPA